MFGAVNALFSGLAFAGVIYAILLQRKELDLQRKELTLTREELRETADASRKQATYMGTQQKRENLYRLISKLADRITNTYSYTKFDGRATLQMALKDDVSPDKNPYTRSLRSEALNSETRTSKILEYLENDLLRLRHLITEYENVTGNKELHSVSRFL